MPIRRLIHSCKDIHTWYSQTNLVLDIVSHPYFHTCAHPGTSSNYFAPVYSSFELNFNQIDGRNQLDNSLHVKSHRWSLPFPVSFPASPSYCSVKVRLVNLKGISELARPIILLRRWSLARWERFLQLESLFKQFFPAYNLKYVRAK